MKFILTLLSAFVLIFSACKSSGDIREPEFRDIGDVRLIETGVLKTTVGANMIYYNPNSFGIKLSAARGDVYVDNAYFGSFVLDQEIQVKKSAEFMLPVTIKICFAALFGVSEFRCKRVLILQWEFNKATREIPQNNSWGKMLLKIAIFVSNYGCVGTSLNSNREWLRLGLGIANNGKTKGQY